MGFIIEAPGFLPDRSAYENLKLLSSVRSKLTKAEIYDILRLVGLDPSNKKHVAKFSMGMKQRLGIAQAIMEDPDILLLDEALNGLDKNGVAEMHGLIKRYKDMGKVILLTSHIQADIDALCDKVYEIENEKIGEIR